MLALFAPQGPPGWEAGHQLGAPALEELWFLPGGRSSWLTIMWLVHKPQGGPD